MPDGVRGATGTGRVCIGGVTDGRVYVAERCDACDAERCDACDEERCELWELWELCERCAATSKGASRCCKTNAGKALLARLFSSGAIAAAGAGMVVSGIAWPANTLPTAANEDKKMRFRIFWNSGFIADR